MRLLTLILASVFSLAACAEAPKEEAYKAGKHYIVLSEPVRTANPNKIEVTEVFWYGCGHCYTFDPMFSTWKKQQAEDINVVLMPAIWGGPMEKHARMFYAAKALRAQDKLHKPMFDALHGDRNSLNSDEQIKTLFTANGVEAEKFDKVYQSFGVTSQIKQAVSKAKAYQITGTPQLIVDGKYRIEAATAGGQSQMLKVVDFLVAKIRAEKAAAAK